MDDAHRRDVRDAGDLVRAQAQVVVLEVQEIAWIEAAEFLQDFGAEQHEAAADDGGIPDDLAVVDDVAHFVAGEALRKSCPKPRRQEAAHEQIEHRRVTAAEILLPACVIADPWCERADVGTRTEKRTGGNERVCVEIDVRIQDQVKRACRRFDREIVPPSVANVAVARQNPGGNTFRIEIINQCSNVAQPAVVNQE